MMIILIKKHLRLYRFIRKKNILRINFCFLYLIKSAYVGYRRQSDWGSLVPGPPWFDPFWGRVLQLVACSWYPARWWPRSSGSNHRLQSVAPTSPIDSQQCSSPIWSMRVNHSYLLSRALFEFFLRFSFW